MRMRIVLVMLATAAASAGAAERTEEITRAFPAGAGKLVLIDAGPLDLSVRSAEITEVRLHISLAAGAFKEAQAAAWLNSHRPTIEDSETALKVVAPDPKGLNLFKGVIVTHARIEVVLPPSVKPDLSTSSGNLQVEGELAGGQPLRLRSATGDVQLQGWAPEVEARTTSGDLQIRAARALTRLLARTSSGSVQLIGGAHSVRCDTSTGDVRLAGLLGPAGIVTTSGGITASFDDLPQEAEVRVESSSGKVRVTLPPNAAPGGELSSARGEIRSAYPGASDPGKPHLALAGGGPKVFITTISGRIELF